MVYEFIIVPTLAFITILVICIFKKRIDIQNKKDSIVTIDGVIIVEDTNINYEIRSIIEYEHEETDRSLYEEREVDNSISEVSVSTDNINTTPNI